MNPTTISNNMNNNIELSNNIESFKNLNLSLSPELYALLETLAKSNDTEIPNIIVNGIALFGIAEEAKQEGHKIAIIDGENTVIKEIEIDLS
ncbi:MAG: hypothetical protein AB4063_12675 [Crocosphaera sp.]